MGMKIGKVPENVLKRSVLKQIQTKREEIVNGAGIGEDCAIFSFGGGEPMMTCVQTAAVKAYAFEKPGADTKGALNGPEADATGVSNRPEVDIKGAFNGQLADMAKEKPVYREAVCMGQLIQRCANNLAAAGAQPVGVMIALMLSEESDEPDIKALMAEAEAKCRELNIQIAGGQTCVSRAVRQSVAAVTGYGRPFAAGCAEKIAGGGKCAGTENSTKGEKGSRKEKVLAGQDVVISKWIGLEGTAILAGRHREKLLQRYPAYLVEEAAGFDSLLSVIPEAATAVKSGVCMMHDASEGGIFGALWELAEKAGVGLTIDLKKIPLRQETVEVCECCDVNPYELLSGGALVMVTEDGPGLVAALEAEKIPAAIVGRVTDSNDRIIMNGDEIRFLDRPKNDEIYRQ